MAKWFEANCGVCGHRRLSCADPDTADGQAICGGDFYARQLLEIGDGFKQQTRLYETDQLGLDSYAASIVALRLKELGVVREQGAWEELQAVELGVAA